MSHLKTQFAKSLISDFQKNTWTFEMKDKYFSVSAGNFAIVPEELYQQILTALVGIKNSMSAHSDCEPDSEFQDIVNRVDEVLEFL